MLEVNILKSKSDTDYQHFPDFHVTPALRQIKSANISRVRCQEKHASRPWTAAVKYSDHKEKSDLSKYDQKELNGKLFARAVQNTNRSVRIMRTRALSAQCRRESGNPDRGQMNKLKTTLSVTGVSMSDFLSSGSAEDRNSSRCGASRTIEYGWTLEQLNMANWGNNPESKENIQRSGITHINEKPRGFVGSTRYLDLLKRKSHLSTPVGREVKETNTPKQTDLKLHRTAKGSLIHIGKGAFGSVIQGQCYGVVVAIKATSKNIALKEAAALRAVRSAYIIKLLKVAQVCGWWGLVLEKAAVSLEVVVRHRYVLDSSAVQHITACMVIAVNDVHAMGWLHLDVKLSNILLTKHGKPKLCDFSSAKPWSKGMKFSGDECYPAGSEGYWAPEIVRREPFDNMADWFSLGVCMYHLIAGKLPWILNDLDMLYKLEEGLIDYEYELFNEEATDLIQKLLRDNTSRRYGQSQANLRAHRWFQGVLWNNAEKGKLRAPPSLQECVKSVAS